MSVQDTLGRRILGVIDRSGVPSKAALREWADDAAALEAVLERVRALLDDWERDAVFEPATTDLRAALDGAQ
jgi:hypothetical protein